MSCARSLLLVSGPQQSGDVDNYDTLPMDPALAAAAVEAAKHEAYQKDLEQLSTKPEEPIPLVNYARTRVMEGTLLYPAANASGAAQEQQKHQEAARTHQLQQNQEHENTAAAIENKLGKEHKDPAAAIENNRGKEHKDRAAAAALEPSSDHQDTAPTLEVSSNPQDAAPTLKVSSNPQHAAPALEAHACKDGQVAAASKSHEDFRPGQHISISETLKEPEPRKPAPGKQNNDMQEDEPLCKRRVTSKQPDMVHSDALPCKPACVDKLPVLSPAQQEQLCRGNCKDQNEEPEPKTKRKPREKAKAKAKAKGRPKAAAKGRAAKAKAKAKGKPKAAAKAKAKAKARSKKEAAADDNGDEIESAATDASKAHECGKDLQEEAEEDGITKRSKRKTKGGTKASEADALPPRKKGRSSQSKAAADKKQQQKEKNARKSKAYQRAKKAALDAGLTLEEAKAKGQQASKHLSSALFHF